jgi:leader peptidase (prepilin peptidase)/N-methyltransferase
VSTTLIFELAAFLLGLLFGSFLNVCIARLPRHQSILKPASHCPTCLHPIRFYDNIPLLSWLLLRARCRDCKSLISWQYPAIELATALWFTLIAARFAPTLTLPNLPIEALATSTLTAISLITLGFLLMGLLVTDWQTHLLPDAFTLPGIAIALFLVCTQAIFLGPTEDQILLRRKAPITAAMSVEKGNVFLTGPEALIGGRILAILAAAGILLAIRAIYKLLRDREGMGLGDVKLLALIAAFLGLRPALLALFLGVFAAALYGIALMLTQRATRATRLPFGSFLAAAGLVAALVGNRLIDTYAALYR